MNDLDRLHKALQAKADSTWRLSIDDAIAAMQEFMGEAAVSNDAAMTSADVVREAPHERTTSPTQPAQQDMYTKSPVSILEAGTYAYCLGLFLAHEWKIHEYKNRDKTARDYIRAEMWFNGAADHLYELQIPSILPPEKQKEIEQWRDKCLAFRLCMNGEKCTYDDCFAATQKAKDFLREWDEFHGIPCEKGDWE